MRSATTRGEAGFHVDNGFVHAPDGRVQILRGFNYANDHKFPDAETGTFFPAWESAADFRQQHSYGFNSLRLVFTWEAVEPQRGVYDETFLNQLDERITWAENAGLWVILDMHQDVFSRTFEGDGAPAWAVDTDGLVFVPKHQWYLNFTSPAVQRAIDNFFADKDGILDRFVDAWAHVVRRFQRHPGLVGYDLLNEPFPGSRALDVARADQEVMNPFYARLLETLATIDTRRLFFLEPNAVRTNVSAGAFPSQMGPFAGVDRRVVFAPHLYDPIVTLSGTYDGNGARIAKNVRALTAEAARLGAALWVGEWSVWDGRVQNGQAFLADQLQAMDDALASWSFWNFSRTASDLTSVTQSPAFLDQLARPQLSKIAGVPQSIHCEASTCQFVYRELAGGEATEILIPAHWSTAVQYSIVPPRPAILHTDGDLSILEVGNQTSGAAVTVSLTK